MEFGKIQFVPETVTAALRPTMTRQERAEQKQLIHAVESVNEAHLFGAQNELRFTQDRHGRRTVLQLVDKETNEIVRQIPPEFVLRLAEDLGRY